MKTNFARLCVKQIKQQNSIVATTSYLRRCESRSWSLAFNDALMLSCLVLYHYVLLPIKKKKIVKKNEKNTIYHKRIFFYLKFDKKYHLL